MLAKLERKKNGGKAAISEECVLAGYQYTGRGVFFQWCVWPSFASEVRLLHQMNGELYNSGLSCSIWCRSTEHMPPDALHNVITH